MNLYALSMEPCSSQKLRVALASFRGNIAVRNSSFPVLRCRGLSNFDFDFVAAAFLILTP
jgi:hypothetical protein